jgi:hypothetical protein
MKITSTHNPMLDHADEDYIKDHNEVAIHCSGHYTVAELRYKIALLEEAQTILAPQTPKALIKQFIASFE